MTDDRKPSEEPDALTAEIKSVLGRAVRRAPVSMESLRRNVVRSKGRAFSPYIQFAIGLPSQARGPLLFLARDALPLKAIVDHVAGREGRSIETRELALPTKVLPLSLRNELERIRREEPTFRAHARAITEYVSANAKEALPLHRYLTQELLAVRDGLLVDTGFWGTCLIYASEYMRAAHSLDLPWRMLFGPPDSGAALIDENEQQWTQFVEGIFSYPFDYSGEIVERGGRLVVEEQRYVHGDPEYGKRYGWEVEGLLDVVDELRERSRP